MNKVKFGLVPPMPGADCQGLVDFSIKADNMGFDSLWFPDHLAFIAPSPAYEAWTIAAAVAQQTKNIVGIDYIKPKKHRTAPKLHEEVLNCFK